MPRMKILNSVEQEEFDSPPVLNSVQRKKYFDLPVEVHQFAGTFRNPTNKVCLTCTLELVQNQGAGHSRSGGSTVSGADGRYPREL